MTRGTFVSNSYPYLPEVYPDQSWTNIKKLLEDKAGNTGAGQTFYAYQCDIYSTSIINTIRQIIIPLVKSQCTKWIEKNYKGEIPYQSLLSSNGWKIQFG